MSTARRGHRGGGDRGGARGAARGMTNNNPFRGASTRGRLNGADMSSAPSTTRDNTSGTPRGGRGRGGLNARGGRGNSQTTAGKSHPIAYDPNHQSNDPWNSTPYAHDDYVNRLAYLEAGRPFIKEELIRRGLMNPDGKVNLSDSVKKYGICEEMCAEYERVRRIVQADFKPPECTPETAHGPRPSRVPDESRMVKAYTRSAAGNGEEMVVDIRTPETCLETMDYMFRRIDQDQDTMKFLYGWIWDRVRQIKKDINVDKKRPDDDFFFVTTLEQCTRWGLYSMHEMASSDHALHFGNDLEQLGDCYRTMRLFATDGYAWPNRAEFVAYDLILSIHNRGTQLGNVDDLEREFSNHRRVHAAIAIRKAANDVLNDDLKKGKGAAPPPRVSIAERIRSWGAFWQAVGDDAVSYLMACAAEVSFKRIRHRIMEDIKASFKPKRDGTPNTRVNDYTAEKLVRDLGFDNTSEVRLFCEHYGIGFTTSPDGREVLDVSMFPRGQLFVPVEIPPQQRSRTIVDPKRGDRSPLAIIQENLQPHDNPMMNEMEDSLFVSDTPFSSLNAKATKFVPPAFSPFSYLQSGGQNGNATPAAAPVQPGLFNASKDDIRFANNAFTRAAAAPSNAPVAAANPFTPKVAEPSKGFQNGQSPFQPAQSMFQTPSQPTSSSFPTPPPSAPSAFPAPSQPVDTAKEEERRKAEEEQRKAEEERRKAEEQQRRIDEENRRAQEERERQAREAEQRRQQAEFEQQRRIQAEQEQRRRVQEEAERRAQAEHERLLEIERIRQAQEAAERYEREERARAYSTLATNLLMDPDQGLMRQMIEHMVGAMAKEAQAELVEERLQKLAEERYQQKRLAFARAVCFRWWEQVQKKKKKNEARLRRQELKAMRARAAIEASAPEVQPPTALLRGSSPNGFRKPEAPASAPRSQVKAPQRMPQSNGSSSRHAQQTSRNKVIEDPVRHVAAVSVHQAEVPAAPVNYSEAYRRSTAPIDRTETKWFELRAMGIDPSDHRKRKSFEMDQDDEEALDLEVKRARRSTSSNHRQSLPPAMTAEERLARIRSLKSSFNGSTTPIPEGSLSITSKASELISRARELLAGSPTPQDSPPAEHSFSKSTGSGFSQPTLQLSSFGRSIGAAPPSEAPAYRHRASRFVPQHLYGQGADAVRAYREQFYGRPAVKNEPLQLSSPIYTQHSYVPTGETQPEYNDAFQFDANGHVDDDGDDEESLISYSTEEEEASMHAPRPPQTESYYEGEDEYGEEYDDDEGEEGSDSEDGFDEGPYYNEHGDEDAEEESEDEDGDGAPGGYGNQGAQVAGATQDDAIELSD